MRPFDFSLVTAPFRMQPGLRRVAAGTPQLTLSRLNGRHLREKSAVLASYASEALVAVPGFDADPALAAIAGEAAGLALPGLESDPALVEVIASLPAEWRTAARLCLAFEEDFAIVDGATATIPWLAVCLPSRWAPDEKVGGHFAAVHAPVADNATLVSAASSLTKLVTGGERWERFVWTVSPEPRLHQHPRRLGASWSDDGRPIGEAAFFRSERQTFIPVPGTAQSVFTIHVETQPLAAALEGADPGVDAAARLHDAIATMSADVLAYKGLDAVRAPLLEWLGSRAARVTPYSR